MTFYEATQAVTNESCDSREKAQEVSKESKKGPNVENNRHPAGYQGPKSCGRGIR